MSFFIVLGIFLWVMVSLAPAIIANKKGYNFWLFWIVSLFFWWITLFVAVFMKDRSMAPEPGTSE